MKRYFINLILRNEKIRDKAKLEMIEYGLEVIYINISKLFFILIVSILLKNLKETTLLIFLLSILKLFAYGIQMDKSYKCYIFSTCIYCVFPFILNFISLKKYIFYITVFSLCSFILYSPSDTKNRPILDKRLIKKILSIVVLIIYIALAFLIKSKIADYFLLVIVIESFIIMPFIYKIFGLPYNNYKEVILWISY